MTTTPSIPESCELDNNLLDAVTGGGGAVFVPTEECPTCASGADPTVLNAQFQNLLAGDL